MVAPNPEPEELRKSLEALAAWRKTHLTGDERGEAQIFLDRLFRAFGHDGIKEAGATLEQRLKKNNQKGTAFADLMWKPRVLIEMKKTGVDLRRTYRQAFDYWVAAVPDRPRYVVLCNFDEFWVYDFESQMDEPVDRVRLEELAKRWESLTFLLPDVVKPQFGNDLVQVTREAADSVVRVFRSLYGRGIDRTEAQTFILQCVMAMFSEDIGLLPSHMFSAALDDSLASDNPSDTAYDLIFGLMREMNTPGNTGGGRFKGTPYFNGGLFANLAPISLTEDELFALRTAAFADWSAVRPEIFGTLFEQSMDAEERHAQGAHFTSQVDIMRIVGPTIVAPWRGRIEKARVRGGGGVPALKQILNDMVAFRVLDPACGSGNFLYVAYREMRRLEHDALTAISELQKSDETQRGFAYVTTDQFHGMDINSFAVELAKVTLMLGKKLAADELGDFHEALPLDNLDATIQARDALLTPWPKADVVIGNPPYLGRRKMVEELGASYTGELTKRYPHVGGVSDFVSYWFPLTQNHLPKGGRAGLVATQAIRDASSRKASLDYVVDHGGVIYDAISSKPWSGDAVVHVCIVNWVNGEEFAPAERILWLDNGDLRLPVDFIPASLKPTTDVAKAKKLRCNLSPKRCYQGQTTGNVGAFRLSKAQARAMIKTDPGARQFIHPVTGGDPMIHTLAPTQYVIDLPHTDLVEARSEVPGVMAYLEKAALPERKKGALKEATRNAELLASDPNAKTRTHHKTFLASWWRHGYRRDEMLEAFSGLSRYIALSRVAAKDRMSIFQFVDPSIRPDDSLSVLALDDDYSLGIVSSSIHRAWFDERCSRLKVDPRYTSTTVWDSFPWPSQPTAAHVAAVAEIAGDIVNLREQYLSQGITLGKQYDALREPGTSKLRKLHDVLDHAVFEAYGFSEEDDLLAQLLALNIAASEEPGNARRPGGAEFAGTYTSTYKLMATPISFIAIDNS